MFKSTKMILHSVFLKYSNKSAVICGNNEDPRMPITKCMRIFENETSQIITASKFKCKQKFFWQFSTGCLIIPMEKTTLSTKI